MTEGINGENSSAEELKSVLYLCACVCVAIVQIPVSGESSEHMRYRHTYDVTEVSLWTSCVVVINQGQKMSHKHTKIEPLCTLASERDSLEDHVVMIRCVYLLGCIII